MGQNTLTRRQFVKRNTSAAVAGLVAGAAPSLAAGRGSANEKIAVGVIGVGGRGSHLTERLLELQEEGLVEVAAVCDVYTKRVERWTARIGCRGCADWHEIIDDRRIDGVVIATPDHWHAPMTIAAADAGKDVYCEKPMTHWESIEEPQAVVRAIARNKRVMQVGTNGMSDSIYRQAAERVRDGALGQLMQAQASDMRNGPIGVYSPGTDDPGAAPGETLDWERWLGPAPKRPYEPGRYFAFRSFWDYSGGTGTDFFPHVLTPLVHVMGLSFPRRVVASGGLYYWRDGREVPDIYTLLIEYPEGPQIYLLSGLASAVNIPMQIKGQSATLTFGGPGAVIEPEPGGARRVEREEIARRKPGSAREHLREWLECMKTRKKPISNEVIGYHVMAALQMGIYSYRENAVMLFDSEKERYHRAS